jgi:D-3-phosphoglycerate dehydrogenase
VAEPIHRDGIQILERECHVVSLPAGSDEAALLSQAEKTDAVISRGFIRITRNFMEASEKLKVIAVHGAGFDHIDLQAARDHNVVVFNTPDALTDAVAELTVALMLSLLRRLVNADKAVRAGEWNRKFSDLVGFELKDKTVGIVGLGRIGEAVARRLRCFNAKIIYYDECERRALSEELGIMRVPFDKILATSDIVTFHVPLTPKTFKMVSDAEFSLMKEGIYLINMARGKIIDEKALERALRSGKVAGAALDVFQEEPPRPDNPLLSFENVILTPHIGASTHEAMKRMSVQCAEGVLKVLKGEKPPNTVSNDT